MKKLLVVLLVLAGCSSSNDVPVEHSTAINSESSATTTQYTYSELSGVDYNPAEQVYSPSPNVRVISQKKSITCSMGYGYDDNGAPCEKNEYYQQYKHQKETKQTIEVQYKEKN